MTDFDTWADEFAARWVRMNPQLATVNQYFDGDEQAALDRDLALSSTGGNFYGQAAASRAAAVAREGLKGLAAFSRESLTPVQRASAAILHWQLNDTIENERFARHRFVFSQMVGFQVGTVAFLASTHPIRDAADIDAYLARLRRFPALLDEGIGEARAAADAGIIPPRFILERTIEQIDSLTGAPETQVLVTTLVDRMKRVPALSEAEIAKAREDAQAIVRDAVIPALDRVRTLLREQLPTSTDDAGAWALPDGEAYYARQLATSTGTSLTAKEIHEIGLRQVAEIEAEMDATLRKLGYTEGSVQERLNALNETKRLPLEPDPRDALLRELQAIMDDAATRSKKTFRLVPAAPCEIRREPAFSERTAAAHYTTPAPDGSQPGVYWIPLADIAPTVPWLGVGLKSTAYHEAIPGHHFQLAIQQETPSLPKFRKLRAFGYNPAFNEGWALYAERLAAEDNWYADDLASYVGYLQQMLFRARRLVVDTGLHAFRWTRQQAIDYGFTVAEIERYVSWPGQACSYLLGQLRILELREQAKAARGERFDLKDFHDLVLAGGTMPLDVLSAEVTAWAH